MLNRTDRQKSNQRARAWLLLPRPRAVRYGAVTDLYIDYHKFKGRDVRAKVGAISQSLSVDYDLHNLIERFNIDRDEDDATEGK